MTTYKTPLGTFPSLKHVAEAHRILYTTCSAKFNQGECQRKGIGLFRKTGKANKDYRGWWRLPDPDGVSVDTPGEEK